MLTLILQRLNPKRHVAQNKNPHKHIIPPKLIRIQQRNMESNKCRRFSSSIIEWIINNINTK